MSMMVCSDCDRLIDTDYDVEGVWEHNGTRFWCATCTECAMACPEANQTIMESLKIQDPVTYQQAIEDAEQ